MNSDGLKRKVIKGSFFVMGANIVSRLISLLSTLILAKILSPEDFGIVGYGFLIVSTIGLIKEMGLNSALIYQKRNVEKFTATVFWAVLVWSAFLYMVTFLIAPLAGSFFKEPRVVLVIRVLSLSLVFTSIANIPMTLMEKDIDFKKRVIPDVIGLSSYGLISIIAAFLGFGYWSFVIGTLLSDIIQIIISFALKPIKIFIRAEKKVFKELFSFGKNVVLLNIMNFLIRNVDDFFVGRLLGTASLGIYQFSYRIGNIPATNITNVFGKVLYPGFAKISEDISRLRGAFLNSFKYISFLTIPLTVYIILIIPDFIKIFLPKWEGAILPIQLIAYFGGLRSLGSGIGSVFLARGIPGKLVPISISQLCVILILIYPLLKLLGIVGACITIDISQTLAFVLSITICSKVIALKLHDLFLAVEKTILFAIISLMLVITMRLLIEYIWGVKELHVFLINLSYIFVYIIIQSFQWGEFRSLIKEIKLSIGE